MDLALALERALVCCYIIVLSFADAIIKFKADNPGSKSVIMVKGINCTSSIQAKVH